MRAKIYKLNGLNYYVVNALNKLYAVRACYLCKIGITASNLSEVEVLDSSAEYVIDAVLNKKFSMQSFIETHIYSEASNDYTATSDYYLNYVSL